MCHLCSKISEGLRCLLYIDNDKRVWACDECVTYDMIIRCSPSLSEAEYSHLVHLSQTCTFVLNYVFKDCRIYRSELNAALRAILYENGVLNTIYLPPVSELYSSVPESSTTSGDAKECVLLKRKLDQVAAEKECLTDKVTKLEEENDDLMERNIELGMTISEKNAQIANMERLYGEQKRALKDEIQRSNTLAKTSPNSVLLHQNVYLISMTDMMRGTISSLQKQLMQAQKMITHLERFRDDHESHLLELRKAAQEAAYGDHQLCLMCQEAPREVVLLFCGHFCVCQACSTKINGNCPVCRQEVNQVSQPVYQC